jgi:hypothetical protein
MIPEQCMERIKQRSRSGEDAISMGNTDQYDDDDDDRDDHEDDDDESVDNDTSYHDYHYHDNHCDHDNDVILLS